MNKLRVVLITQEEPFYLPKMIRHILANQGEDFEIVGATRLQPHRKNKTMKDWVLERTQVYTYWELFITTVLFVYAKFIGGLLGVISGVNPFKVGSYYKKYKIEEINTLDLNDLNYVKKLEALQPDLVVSISPPQIFKAELLGVARIHSLNVHGTLLPRHRGVFGSWWTINDNDKEAGGTIHTMELKLDAGEIAWQEAFPVESKDTQYSIAYKTKKSMSIGLMETFKNIRNGSLKMKPVEYATSYHRAPTKEQGKKFHQEGKRVITIRDAFRVTHHSFRIK